MLGSTTSSCAFCPPAPARGQVQVVSHSHLVRVLSTATTPRDTSSQNMSPFLFLGDGKGHINPELATRIYNWEQEQRVNLNLPEFQRTTTRQELRWVQDIVAETLKLRVGDDKKYYDDLIQEGVIALMQSMKHYEHDARPKESFEAFAKQHIRAALRDYYSGGAASRQNRKTLSMETTVEIEGPLETHYSNQDEWEVREGLVLDLDNGQSVGPDELVGEFIDEALQYEGEDQMWVQQQQVAAPLKDSIPDLLDTDTDTDQLSPDDLALNDMIRFNVDEFLGSSLDDLESQIIQMRFGLEGDGEPSKTYKEIAFDLNLSVSKVKKLQKTALEKLKNAYADRYVSDDDHYWEDSV